MKNKKVERKYQMLQHRHFSEGIKKQTVKDIEAGRCTVLEASRELLVSRGAVYKWVHLYSRYLTKSRVMIVEDKSEVYRSKELERRLQELEAALGRKQMEVDFLNKIIDLANTEYQTDLKKILPKAPSAGSRSTKGKNTSTK
jgi:transposase-like protein